SDDEQDPTHCGELIDCPGEQVIFTRGHTAEAQIGDPGRSSGGPLHSGEDCVERAPGLAADLANDQIGVPSNAHVLAAGGGTAPRDNAGDVSSVTHFVLYTDG